MAPVETQRSPAHRPVDRPANLTTLPSWLEMISWPGVAIHGHTGHLWMQLDLKRWVSLSPKRRASLSLWNLDKVRQNKGACERWILPLHSHVNAELGPLWGVLVYSSRSTDPWVYWGGGPRKHWSGKGKERRKGGNTVKHISTVGKWSFILLGNSESQGRTCASELSWPRGEGTGGFILQLLLVIAWGLLLEL